MVVSPQGPVIGCQLPDVAKSPIGRHCHGAQVRPCTRVRRRTVQYTLSISDEVENRRFDFAYRLLLSAAGGSW